MKYFCQLKFLLQIAFSKPDQPHFSDTGIIMSERKVLKGRENCIFSSQQPQLGGNVFNKIT